MQEGVNHSPEEFDPSRDRFESDQVQATPETTNTQKITDTLKHFLPGVEITVDPDTEEIVLR